MKKHVRRCPCRACDVLRAKRQRTYFRALSPEKRERALAGMRANHVERRRAFRAWIDGIKLGTGCVDCGYKGHPAALEFDHLRDKHFEIGSAVSRARDVVLAEIQKCEVVCANCHRIRTAARRVVG